MRHERPLTPEIENILRDRTKVMAHEMDVDRSYLDGILSGYRADPLAHLIPIFKATCRTDLSLARPVLDRLNSIYEAEVGRESKRSDFHLQLGMAMDRYSKIINKLGVRRINELSREEKEVIRGWTASMSSFTQMAEVFVSDSLQEEMVSK